MGLGFVVVGGGAEAEAGAAVGVDDDDVVGWIEIEVENEVVEMQPCLSGGAESFGVLLVFAKGYEVEGKALPMIVIVIVSGCRVVLGLMRTTFAS